MVVTTPVCRQPSPRPPVDAPHKGNRRKETGPAGSTRWSDDPEVMLMMRVRHDDREAFAQLVSRYWTRVLGRFCRWLGDREEAEDLTQEVFLRLYRSRNRYEPRARFATWLFHIAHNVGRNALRSRRRRPCLPVGALPEPEAVEALLPDRQEPPSLPLERAELAGRVRSAVSDLDERQRTAVELHQFEDWTYTEVAAALDMTPMAAKSLLYRARNQLRQRLESYVVDGTIRT